MFDQRLFNQETGISSSLGADDDYNVYDKALFKTNTQNYIYRKKDNGEMDETEMAKLIETSTKKFKPDTVYLSHSQSSTPSKPHTDTNVETHNKMRAQKEIYLPTHLHAFLGF